MWSERSGSQHQEKTLLLRGAATAGFYLQFTKYRRHSPSVFRQIHNSVRQTAGPSPCPSPSHSLVSWSHHMTRNNSSHQRVIVSDFFFSPPPPKNLEIIPFPSSFVATFLFYLCIIILTSRRASKLSLIVECFGSSGYRVCTASPLWLWKTRPFGSEGLCRSCALKVQRLAGKA